jgi:hydrogenase maturation factor
MALATSSGLETFSTVLTKDQVRRLRLIQSARSADHKRVSMADIAREVVEAGLVEIARVSDIAFGASEHDVSASQNEPVAA